MQVVDMPITMVRKTVFSIRVIILTAQDGAVLVVVRLTLQSVQDYYLPYRHINQMY